MSLADFKVVKRTIEGKGFSFEVRGLGFEDFASLLQIHLDDLGEVLDLYEKQGVKELNQIAIGKMFTGIVKDAPGLVASIIATAADEPDMVNQASKLPIITQYEALAAVFALTCEEVGNIKKILESVGEIAKDFRKNAKQGGSGS